MADILHQLHIEAPPADVFDAVTTKTGLNAWWTKESSGHPEVGVRYRFFFSPDFDWIGVVVRAERGRIIAWDIIDADDDWTGTRVELMLTPGETGTRVEFRHLGWKEANEHFRISSFCWASYLRLLRRYVEFGEVVPYDERDAP